MKTYDIIELLSRTPSDNEILRILRNLKDEEFEIGDPRNTYLASNTKFVFLWTYSPRLNYYIKKVDLGKIRGPGSLDFDKDIESDSSLVVELLDSLSERRLVGQAAISKMYDVLGRFDTKSADLIVRIIKRDLRCGVNVSTVNKVWPNWIPEFKVQLANKFDPSKPKSKFYYVNRKMDGLRGIFIPGEGLFTRQGKRIQGFDDTIIKDLEDFSAMNLGCAVDGELFSVSVPFEEIQGAVMTSKNVDPGVKRQIQFHAFALVRDFWGQKVYGTTEEMLGVLSKMGGYEYLKPVETELVRVEDVDVIHDRFVSEGYEGIMLRDPKVSYEFKRGDGLLKYKKFLESDFVITDVYEGNGKFQGALGGFVVRGEYEGKVIKSEVGTGFSEKQRGEWFDRGLIGSLVEVRFQGVTEDGSLRFPTFVKFKKDR